MATTIPLTILRKRAEITLNEIAETLDMPPEILWDRAINTIHGRHPKLDDVCPQESKLIDTVDELHRAEKAAFYFEQ